MTGWPLPEEDIRHVLRDAGTVWDELRGRRIFITGATGFVGRWMLESLLAADRQCNLGVRVVALSRTPEKFQTAHPHFAAWSNLSWLRGSVTTLASDAMVGERFDLVIHLATEGDLSAIGANPTLATDVIAGGTRRTLEVAVRTGARRFLFTSSGSVHGSQRPGIGFLSESHADASNTRGGDDAKAIGGRAKFQAEQYCADFIKRQGICVVIARGFTFAGPGMPLDGNFAFGNFMRDALAGRRVVVTGDGTPIRSYLYASDLAVWLWTLLIRGGSGGIYNVGSEQAIRLRDLAERIVLELGAPGYEVMQQPEPGRPPDCYVPSTERARKELGLRETVGIVESIRKTAEWLRH